MIDRSLNYGRPIIKQFLKSIRNVNSIVDIGAGTGVDLDIAHQVFPDAQILGIEVHPPYIGDLEKKGYLIRSANIERDNFPFNDHEIDVVMANQILEHTKEIFWIWHEISRILKVGGYFILGVPNLASLHNRILLALGFQPTAIHVGSAHVRGFTKPGIKQFLHDVCPGLYNLKSFRGSNFYPFPAIIAKPMARAFPSMAAGSFYLLKKEKEYHGEILEFAAPGKMETNYYTGK